MLLSHRAHGFGSALIGLDQAIAPTFAFRRVRLRGLVQDQRTSASLLGVDAPRRRHSLSIALDGFCRETAGDRELRVEPGSLLCIPLGATSAGRGYGDLLEIEWDGDALGGPRLGATVDALRLAETTMRAACLVAQRLTTAAHVSEVRAAFSDLLRALRSEGLDFDLEAADSTPLATDDEQRVHETIDARLSQLDTSPMLVDIESSLNVSTRTLTRRVRQLQERYRLPGGETWRKARDHYRLVVATILLSNAEATGRSVASAVGYGSFEALCHAFRSAGLPAPDAYRRAVLAA